MKFTCLALIVLSAIPLSAGAGEPDIEVGGGYASIHVSLPYVGNPDGYQFWGVKHLTSVTSLRIEYARASLSSPYYGVFPYGTFPPPDYQPVRERVERSGSVSMVDLTLMFRPLNSRRLHLGLGGGLGASAVELQVTGASTGAAADWHSGGPHLVARAELGAIPLGTFPLGLQISYSRREVLTMPFMRAEDGYDPFKDPFGVDDLKVSLFYRL